MEVTIISLWMPIVVSAVLVWLASAVVWMVLPYHKTDYKGLPDEDGALNALRPQNLEAGQYNIPHCQSMDDIKKPEIAKKFEEGPAGFLIIVPKGLPNMGKSLGQWFAFNMVIGVIVAYLASRTLPADATYLSVFRIAGTTAWLAYGMAHIADSIWMGRPWSMSAKYLFDALIYGLLTAGAFGWLWPN